MKPVLPGIIIATLTASGIINASTGSIPVTIDCGTQLSWETVKGFEYQLQVSESRQDEEWQDRGARVAGTGRRHSVFHPGNGKAGFRILCMRPGFLRLPDLLSNGSFERGQDTVAEAWRSTGSQPLARSRVDAHNGSFSMHCKLSNVESTPVESLLSQIVQSPEGKIQTEDTWSLSFRTKTVNAGPSYIQQYQLAWLDESGQTLESLPFIPFKTRPGVWQKTSGSGLLAPEGAFGALIRFRFVTGAVKNGHGEVYLDDVEFTAGNSALPQAPTTIAPETSTTSRLSWHTRPNWIYLPFETTIAPNGSRSSLIPTIKGDGSAASVAVTREIADNLRAELPASLSLLSPSDISAEYSAGGRLSISWKRHPHPLASYRILHGEKRILLSSVIDTGSSTMGVIPNLKPRETRSFAVLAIFPSAP